MNLSAIVSHAIETMKPFLGSRQIDLVVDMGSNPLWVEADYYRFTQVIANILHNAAKYTAPCARVAVRVREEGTDAVVSIRDAGKGIPETLLPYIFDLFVQGDQSLSRTEAGLGIGLTLARSIVGLHNGSIVAESAGLGQGSEFIVRIPLSNPPQETLPPSSETAGGQPSIGLRILVVDDNPALVATCATLLRLLGHELETALNGSEALERCTSFQPHVVLLDVGLPGLDGFAVARELRGRDGGQRLRIVGISGYGHKEYQDMGKEAGFDAYLVKPVDPDELERLLTTFLQDSKRPS